MSTSVYIVLILLVQLQLAFLGAGCTASDYRVLPAYQQIHAALHGHTNCSSVVASPRCLSPLGRIRSASSMRASPSPSRKMSEGAERWRGAAVGLQRGSTANDGSLLGGILAPACSATLVAAPMPGQSLTHARNPVHFRKSRIFTWCNASTIVEKAYSMPRTML